MSCKTSLKFKKVEGTTVRTLLRKIKEQKEHYGKDYKLVRIQDDCVGLFVYPKTGKIPRVSDHFDIKSYKQFAEPEDINRFHRRKTMIEGCKEEIQSTVVPEEIQIYLIQYTKDRR